MASGTKISALSTISILSGGEVFPLVQSGVTRNTTITSLFSAPTMITPKIQDVSSDHQYSVGVSELAANRTVTLPLLSDNDTFVFEGHTQTLTNKTLTSPAVTGGTVDNAVIGGTTPAAVTGTTVTADTEFRGTVLTTDSTSALSLKTTGGTHLRLLNVASIVNNYTMFGTATGVTPALRSEGSDTNVNSALDTKGAGFITLRTNSNTEQVRVTNTTSAVNFWQLTGSATGSTASLGLQGSDANTTGQITAKGTTGAHVFLVAGLQQVVIGHTASAVNYVHLKGGATGDAPTVSALGSDTNIDLALTPKGSGVVTTSTMTATTEFRGTILTSNAATDIVFNTTGGTQFRVIHNASVACSWAAQGGAAGGFANLLTAGSDTNIAGRITSKGTDSLHFYTNTNGQEQFRVDHVASAVNFQATTGSTTGNPPYFITTGTDTNIESGIVSKGASQVRIATGTIGNIQLRISNTSSAVDYWQLTGGASSSIFLSAQGASTDVNQIFGTKGSGFYRFDTNGTGGNTQLLIAHKASAVNRVQVTGGVIAGSPTVQSEGSDTNIGFVHATKGTGSHAFFTGSVRQFNIANTASAVNYVQVTGNVTSGAVQVLALGSDSNIDLRLTTKGTGVVRFGTHTTLGAESVTGYITIKDDGGTERKIAVVS